MALDELTLSCFEVGRDLRQLLPKLLSFCAKCFRLGLDHLFVDLLLPFQFRLVLSHEQLHLVFVLTFE